jgi:phosphonoacetaldehyde hydrolase
VNKQLFVFDVAGTLVDLGSRAPVIAFQKAFAEHGLYPTEKQIKQPMGKNKLEHVKEVFRELFFDCYEDCDEKCVAIYESFNKHIIPAIKETNEPIEGVVEALEKLDAAGHAIAFTTGYNATQANLALAKLDAVLSFTAPLTTATDSPGRPTPHMIYRSMLLTETNVLDYVWKIGDTTADMEAAFSAGIDWGRTIHVESGSSLFTDGSGRFTYHSCPDVPTFIKKVLNDEY